MTIKAMKNKKAQLTIFIIVGMLIIAVIGLLVYINMREGAGIIEAATGQIPNVPPQFNPINQYITECITKTGTEAVKKIGDNGGYIDPIKEGLRAGEFDATEGSAVEMAGEWAIPYWYYMKSDNGCQGNCEFSFGNPSLFKGSRNSIEQRIEDYINSNIDDCINFDEFRGQGYDITEQGKFKATVKIAKDSVIATADYPVDVSIKGEKTRLEKFYATIPVDLMSIYKTAVLITNLEEMHSFLEKDALNLIVAFSEKDREKLPPMAATGIEFAPSIRWSKTIVKKEIEAILGSYIQLLQVENTLNYEYRNFAGDPLKEAIYNTQMTIPLNESNNLAVKFTYIPMWPIYFDLNCDGDVCEPESASSTIMTLFGVQRYNFAYDLSFPVMVEITDPTALNNKGYTFRYFLEANIRNNEIMKTDSVTLPVVEDNFGSLMCSKKNSGEITVNANDADQKLDGVTVTYTCGPETCKIGDTKSGILKDNFPICLGGIVSFIKDGYVQSSQILSTKLDKEEEVYIDMNHIMKKKIIVKKNRMVKQDKEWIFRDNPLYLSRTEQAMVVLTRKGDLMDTSFTATADYYGNNTEEITIEIAPGNYEINIQLLNNKPFTISEREECPEGGMGAGCYKLPEMSFNESIPSGGVKLNYTFTREDLSKNSTIIFNTISFDFDLIPESERDINDINQISNVDEYSKNYEQILKPGFE